MLKKLIVVLLVLLVVMSHTIAYGQNDNADFDTIIEPQYTHISKLINLFKIEYAGNASIDAYFAANSGTSVSLEIQLQRYQSGNWTTIKTWQQSSSSGTSISVSENWYVPSGYYYRTIATGRVYQNGVLVEQGSEISSSIWW